MSNPDVALGNAEQFLLTMSSINELAPRLHLWSFKLDYDQLERVRAHNNWINLGGVHIVSDPFVSMYKVL